MCLVQMNSSQTFPLCSYCSPSLLSLAVLCSNWSKHSLTWIVAILSNFNVTREHVFFVFLFLTFFPLAITKRFLEYYKLQNVERVIVVVVVVCEGQVILKLNPISPLRFNLKCILIAVRAGLLAMLTLFIGLHCNDNLLWHYPPHLTFD